MNLKHQVGLRVRDLRHAAGLSQQALAERIGKSTQTISEIERGVFAPSFETIESLARALKVGPALLFPSSLSVRRGGPKDETLSAIVAGAAQLPRNDAEILRVFVEALLAREGASS